MTISIEQLDKACDLVERNYPPENSVEAYDYCCEELERLVESCIQLGIHLNHPAVLNYKEAKQAERKKTEEIKRLNRNVCVETVADLQALLSELPPDIPLKQM